jgi:hypothetical protein
VRNSADENELTECADAKLKDSMKSLSNVLDGKRTADKEATDSKPDVADGTNLLLVERMKHFQM